MTWPTGYYWTLLAVTAHLCTLPVGLFITSPSKFPVMYVTVLCIFSLSPSGSTSIVTTASTTSAPAEEGGVSIRQHSRRKKMLSSSRRWQSRVPSSSQEEGEGERREEGSQMSVPTTPDSSVSMDLGRDGMEVLESSSGTPKSPVSRMASAPEATPPKAQGAKVRLSGSYSVPLTVIEEPVGETEANEQGLTPGEEEEREQRQIQRSPSPVSRSPRPPRGGFPPTLPLVTPGGLPPDATVATDVSLTISFCRTYSTQHLSIPTDTGTVEPC